MKYMLVAQQWLKRGFRVQGHSDKGIEQCKRDALSLEEEEGNSLRFPSTTDTNQYFFYTQMGKSQSRFIFYGRWKQLFSYSCYILLLCVWNWEARQFSCFVLTWGQSHQCFQLTCCIEAKRGCRKSLKCLDFSDTKQLSAYQSFYWDNSKYLQVPFKQYTA